MLEYAILGLPRSLTAWLSVFMSQSNTHCYHDGFNGCYSVSEYIKKIDGCGDSSTGLMIMDFNKRFPNTKTVVIKKSESDLKRCIEWTDKMYGTDSKEPIMMLNDQLLNVEGLVINQSEIFDNLDKIWCHLVSDAWKSRYKNLTNFNIQIQSKLINEKAAISFVDSLRAA